MAKLSMKAIKNKILSNFGTNEKVLDTYTSTKDKSVWILWQNEVGDYRLNCFLYGYYEEPKCYSVNAGVCAYDIKDSIVEKYYMNCTQQNRENKFFVEWLQTRQEIKDKANKLKNLKWGDTILFGQEEKMIDFYYYCNHDNTQIVADLNGTDYKFKISDLKIM